MELRSSKQEVKLLKCGVRFTPPAVIVTYTVSSKTRCRIMPLRNFSKNCGVQRVAAELKQTARHKQYLEGMPAAQLEKLISMLHDQLNGMSRDEVIAKAQSLKHIDPNEDLNKVVFIYSRFINFEKNVKFLFAFLVLQDFNFKSQYLVIQQNKMRYDSLCTCSI